MSRSGGQPASAGSGSLPVVAVPSPSATPAFAAGNAYNVTLDKNIAPTLSASGTAEAVVDLVLTQDATGGRTVTWPGSISWRNGVTPSMPTTAGATLLATLVSFDGGTTWFGDAGGNAIEAWRVVGAASQPAFGSGWSNSGGANMTMRFAKTASGLFLAEGVVSHTGVGGTVFTAPVGYRPSADVIFPAWGLVGGAYQVLQGKMTSTGLFQINAQSGVIAPAGVSVSIRAEQ